MCDSYLDWLSSWQNRPNLAKEEFFKSLNKDVIIAKQDAKANANMVYRFDSYKSVVML
jgi:hypothetical protein